MNPETSILPTDKRFVFIGGLHRSGTSLVHEILKAHHEVSGFTNTGAPEDEGQHLQSVYAPSSAHGTFGTFGFDPDAHLTEESPLATPQSATLLMVVVIMVSPNRLSSPNPGPPFARCTPDLQRGRRQR